jgi:predicted RNA polymerase sigma factor
VQLNRAVALGEADGPVAGLAAPATVDPALPRHTAASAYLHEKAGDPRTAARLYADAARSTPHLAERHHLTGRQRGSVKRCADKSVGQPLPQGETHYRDGAGR